MMKRWWVLAVLLTLALSLTSCSGGPALNDGSDYGYVQCQGSLGVFDVYLTPSKADPTLFELSIVPAQVTNPGDIISVTAANSQTLSYRPLVTQATADDNVEIFGGDLTENDLQVFNEIAITSFVDGGTNFLAANSAADAICAIPQPGDDGGN